MTTWDVTFGTTATAVSLRQQTPYAESRWYTAAVANKEIQQAADVFLRDKKTQRETTPGKYAEFGMPLLSRIRLECFKLDIEGSVYKGQVPMLSLSTIELRVRASRKTFMLKTRPTAQSWGFNVRVQATTSSLPPRV